MLDTSVLPVILYQGSPNLAHHLFYSFSRAIGRKSVLEMNEQFNNIDFDLFLG